MIAAAALAAASRNTSRVDDGRIERTGRERLSGSRGSWCRGYETECSTDEAPCSGGRYRRQRARRREPRTLDVIPHQVRRPNSTAAITCAAFADRLQALQRSLSATRVSPCNPPTNSISRLAKSSAPAARNRRGRAQQLCCRRGRTARAVRAFRAGGRVAQHLSSILNPSCVAGFAPVRRGRSSRSSPRPVVRLPTRKWTRPRVRSTRPGRRGRSIRHDRIRGRAHGAQAGERRRCGSRLPPGAQSRLVSREQAQNAARTAADTKAKLRGRRTCAGRSDLARHRRARARSRAPPAIRRA